LFKVTDFGTNRKHVRGFLLSDNNTNLHLTSHRLLDISRFDQINAFDKGSLSLMNWFSERISPYVIYCWKL